MRIVVCVKQVLDPRGLTVNRKAEKVFVNREDYMLDPASRAALHVATTVRAMSIASNGVTPPEIVAMSLGPDRVDDALREAMALGADRAIWLRDAAFDRADALVTANALAAAARKLGEFDLILLGARSLDTGAGEMAARLAEALDLPQLIDAVTIDIRQGKIAAVCRLGDVFVRTSAAMPVVASIVAEAFGPTHPNGWRLMDAYKKWTVVTWSAADLGLGEDDVQPMAAKKEDAFPPERQPGTRVQDVAELAALLKRERII